MNFAQKLTEKFVAKKAIWFVIIAIFAALSVLLARSAKFEENIYDLVAFNDKTIDAHKNFAQYFSGSNTLYINVFAENSADKICDSLVSELSQIPEITDITYNILPTDIPAFVEEFSKLAPSTFDEIDMQKLRANSQTQILRQNVKSKVNKLHALNSAYEKYSLKFDPLNFCGIFSAKLAGLKPENSDASSGKIKSEDGKNTLIILHSSTNSANSAQSSALMEKINKVISKYNRSPVEISYAGAYVISADNAKSAKKDSTFALILTLTFIAFVCFLCFKNKLFAPLALLPSIVGTWVAFAALALMFDTISSIAIAFASIAIGVSVDYAFHILYRADSRSISVLEAAKELRLPIFTVSGTTAAAFVIMFFIGSKGFAQLGIFGAIGVVISALASLYLLPKISAKIRIKKLGQTHFEKYFSSFSDIFFKHKKALIILALFATAAALFEVTNLGFESNISAFNAISKKSKLDDAKIKKVWEKSLSQKFLMVEANKLDEALKINEELAKKLLKNGQIKFVSIANTLPSKQTRINNLEAFKAVFNPEKIAEIEDAFNTAYSENKIGLANLKSALAPFKNPKILELSDLQKPPFDKIFSSYIGVTKNSAAVLTKLVESKNLNDEKILEFIETQAPECSFISYDFLGRRIAQNTYEWFFKFSLVSMFVIVAFLLAVFRKLRPTLAVVFSVFIGLLWSFAILAFLGVKINIISVIFVLFAVCVTQDYAVFLIQAKSESDNYYKAFTPVAVSALTTIFAFATLAVAQNPVLKSLGTAAAISIASILAASLIFTPLIMDFKNGKKREY